MLLKMVATKYILSSTYLSSLSSISYCRETESRESLNQQLFKVPHIANVSVWPGSNDIFKWFALRNINTGKNTGLDAHM